MSSANALSIRAPRDRESTWPAAWPATLATLALSGCAVGALAAADGGYFPSDWGWGSVALAAVAAVALRAGRDERLGGLALLQGLALCAFLGWTLCSLAWTSSPTRTVLEAERTTLYLAALVAILSVTRSRSADQLLTGSWAAAVLASCFGLATRLFPTAFATPDPLANGRLSEPLGYWNAVGLMAALGALIALGIASESRRPVLRALAAASLPLFLPALAFTLSRGAWLALAAGLIVSFTLSTRRLRLLACFAVFGAPAAVAAWLAWRSPLLGEDIPSGGGRTLMVALAGCALLAFAASIGLDRLRMVVRVGARARRGIACVLVLAAFAAGGLVAARVGSPLALASRVTAGFAAPRPAPEANPNARLFTASGGPRHFLWRVAWANVRRQPWLGSGAGTFELGWARDRPLPSQARDAHNLYLETLSELGIPGLTLLALALGAPLAAAVRLRRRPLVAAAAGTYAAYLLHAAFEWDWEMPAVTVLALVCGAFLLTAGAARAPRPQIRAWPRRLRVVGAVVIGGAAVFGLGGNLELSKSAGAAAAGDWSRAARAASRARGWAPWSTEPLRRLAEAELGRGDTAAAARSFRSAIDLEADDWRLWLGLARAESGPARARALRQAKMLDPLGPEVLQFRRDLRARGHAEGGYRNPPGNPIVLELR